MTQPQKIELGSRNLSDVEVIIGGIKRTEDFNTEFRRGLKFVIIDIHSPLFTEKIADDTHRGMYALLVGPVNSSGNHSGIPCRHFKDGELVGRKINEQILKGGAQLKRLASGGGLIQKEEKSQRIMMNDFSGSYGSEPLEIRERLCELLNNQWKDEPGLGSSKLELNPKEDKAFYAREVKGNWFMYREVVDLARRYLDSAVFSSKMKEFDEYRERMADAREQLSKKD